MVEKNLKEQISKGIEGILNSDLSPYEKKVAKKKLTKILKFLIN